MIHEVFPIKIYHKNSGIDHSNIIKEMLYTMGSNAHVTDPSWHEEKGYASWIKYFWTDDQYYGKAHLNPAFNQITNFIDKCLIEYQEELGLDISMQEIKCTSSYLNFHDKQTSTYLHDHEGNVVVGTYYISMEGNCPPLSLYNPSTVPFKGKHPWNTAKFKKEWKEEISFFPDAGDLFLWPGDILHGVESNGSWYERYFLNMGFHFFSNKVPNFPPL